MPVQPTDLFLANRNNVSYRTTGLEVAEYVNTGVNLESLGIPNHEQVVVSPTGDVTATSFTGDGSNLTNVSQPTLASLNIPNHNLVTVNANGDVTANSFSGNGSNLTGIQAGTWEKIASSGTASGALATVVFDNFTGYKYVKVYCTLRSFTSGSSNRQARLRFINSSGASATNSNYYGGVNGLDQGGAHMATNTGSNGDHGKLVLDSNSNLPLNSASGTLCEFFMKVGTYPIIQYTMTNFGSWNNSTGWGYGKVNGFIGMHSNTNCRGFQLYDSSGNTMGWLDYYIEGLKV